VSSDGSHIAIEEALAFIALNPHSFLLGQRADGYPTAYAMMARVADGAVEFSTYRASAKVRNLLRNGHAGVVAAADADDDPRVLVAGGPVELVEGEQWVRSDATVSMGKFAGARNVPAAISDKVKSRHGDGKRAVIRVTLDRARFASKVTA